MQTEPDASAATPSTSSVRDLQAIVTALVVAVILGHLVSRLARTGALPWPIAQVLVADLAVWAPLSLSVSWVLRRSTPAALVRRLSLGWADAVAAVGIVLVCRGLDAFLSAAFFGSTGPTPQTTLGPPDTPLLIVSAISVCLVSPALEELVFRGLFQRRLAAALTPRTRFLAVLLSAFLFALVHLLIGSPANPLTGLEVFVTTFTLGLLTGILVAMTDRIGGAVLAHVLFNAVAVTLSWPR